MISRIIEFSIRRRWLVVLACFIASALGVWSLARMPIDAVPDITNNQVQINTVAPALSPVEIEKQVTFPIETALAGIPGLEYTRSLSRNGFSQVTAVFDDKTDIYFARQQVNERLLEVRSSLPPGAEPRMGPVSTGLGEIYMWTVEYQPPDRRRGEGRPAGLAKRRRYLTPDGQRLTSDLERAAYLRTVQDWIIRPQLKGVPGVAGVDAIGGYVKQYQVQPDPSKLIALGLSFGDIAARSKRTISVGAPRPSSSNGEGYVVRSAGRVETRRRDRGHCRFNSRKHPRSHQGCRRGQDRRQSCAPAAPAEQGKEVVVGTALMLIGANSRTVSAAVDAKIEDIRRTLPPDIARQNGARTAPSSSTPPSRRCARISPRARCSSSLCCFCCSEIFAPR